MQSEPSLVRVIPQEYHRTAQEKAWRVDVELRGPVAQEKVDEIRGNLSAKFQDFFDREPESAEIQIDVLSPRVAGARPAVASSYAR